MADVGDALVIDALKNVTSFLSVVKKIAFFSYLISSSYNIRNVDLQVLNNRYSLETQALDLSEFDRNEILRSQVRGVMIILRRGRRFHFIQIDDPIIHPNIPYILQGFYIPLTKIATLQALADVIKSAGVTIKALSLRNNNLGHLTDIVTTFGGTLKEMKI